MSEIPQKEFYKLNEVCQYTDTQPYVLRFWEGEFPQLNRGKRSGGNRVYSRSDIDLVQRIKRLLYEEEYTIAGARKRLEEESARADPSGTLARGVEPADGALATGLPAAAAPAVVGSEEPLGAITARLPLETTEPDSVSRERYENALEEIDHLRLQLKEAEKLKRKAEAALERSTQQVENLRARSERAQQRLTRLLEELD